jgi:hypothetical protein
LIDVADLGEQRGGGVHAPAKVGDAGCSDRLPAERFGDLPLVAGHPCPVKRLVGDGVRDLGPPGLELGIDAQLEGLGEDQGIVEPSGDGLQLGQDSGFLGAMRRAPQTQGLRAENAHARHRWASAPGRLSVRSIPSNASAWRFRMTQ